MQDIMDHWISPPNTEITVFSVSLGMVVIDEIRLPSRAPMIDVAGGSAIYATLGCRLFAGCGRSGEVGCIVLAGEDFPDAIKDELESWKLSLIMIACPKKLSTRGLLEYDEFGGKKFRYTTPPLKPLPANLIGSPLLSSKAFHLLATPQEVVEYIPELIRLRVRAGIHNQPYIVWEPLPAACTTENRRSFLEACKLVNVFSPNHHEMTALFEDEPQEKFIPETLEKYAFEFAQHLSNHTLKQSTVVIRAGNHGSLTTTGSNKARWLPAFYHDLSSPKIVDPTGAGNTFLGGFLAGWHCTHDVEEASMWGNVAASLALEQIGLPSRRTEGGQELWNEVSVLDRLKEYKARIEPSPKLH